MTPKERAWQLVDIRNKAEQLMVSQFGMDIDHPDEFENDIRAIEDAINAAVEEKDARIAELESIITHSRQADQDAWLGRKIKAAVEEATKQLEAENARMRTALEIFEDGANWDRYPGLRDLPIYEWCHDSDPRVLAQDACTSPVRAGRERASACNKSATES